MTKVDFPSQVNPTNPDWLLGANATVPAKTPISPAGRALIAAVDDPAQRFMLGIGPPSTGAHVTGELFADGQNTQWICIIGGTPGTWRGPGTQVLMAASQAAMLALTAKVGDVAVRTDTSESFILAASPASTLANWTLIATVSTGFTWSGDWSNVTNYTTNDVVAYNGGSYIATQASLNVLPSVGAPYWGTLAEPGSGISEAYADTLYRKRTSYTHTQGVASTLWTINHNLGTYPAVTVRDSTGDVVEVSIQYVGTNTIQISVALPFSGVAYLT